MFLKIPNLLTIKLIFISFDSYVVPVMHYCSSIWSYKTPIKIEQVQNRAICYFFGLRKTGQMCKIDTGKSDTILQFLLKIPLSRLTRKVFDQEYKLCKNNWCEQTKQILCEYGLQNNYQKLLSVNTKEFQTRVHHRQKQLLEEQCQLKPKLRTYCKITDFSANQSSVNHTSRVELIMLSKFSMGLLP